MLSRLFKSNQTKNLGEGCFKTKYSVLRNAKLVRLVILHQTFFVGRWLTTLVCFAFPYKGRRVLNAEKLKILDNVSLVTADKKSETFD